MIFSHTCDTLNFTVTLTRSFRNMSGTPRDSMRWSSHFTIKENSRASQLSGDKILLPPSALEQLLAATSTAASQWAQHQYRINRDPLESLGRTIKADEHDFGIHADERFQSLPHPLTFRLENPKNGRSIYAGIREFSAEEGHVVVSKFLKEALGLNNHDSTSNIILDDNQVMANSVDNVEINDTTPKQLTVSLWQLPKGTFVKLRPLEAGYDAADWKALLEQYLRINFTTLTKGEILVVPGSNIAGGKKEEFQFLVDQFQPGGDGVCIIDTDLEVDIEALNEEQARETLKRIAAKYQRDPVTNHGSSTGGNLHYLQETDGQIYEGDYVDYELSSWDRQQGLEIELISDESETGLDLYVSPYSNRQRVRPREDVYVWGEFDGKLVKRIRISPRDIVLDNTDVEAMWITVHSWSAQDNNTAKSTESRVLTPYRLKATPFDLNASNDSDHVAAEDIRKPDEVQCKNCRNWIPQRTLVLHENFCFRNNVLCPKGCGMVFQKRSLEYQNHWHCPHDSSFGNGPLSLLKHDHFWHTQPTCVSCDRKFSGYPALAMHRTTQCPGKLILCQFCHLEVPQEGDPNGIPDPEVLLTGLTPHELADGARTTECHLCDKIVRLRDMATHLKHHDLSRKSRPEPRICRNVLCGRTLDGVDEKGDTRAGTRKGNGPGNEIGLCSLCFGPLYVSVYDPDGKALKRRVERRYLSQLMTGCGKSWCRNEYCRIGRLNLGIATENRSMPIKESLPMIKPFLEGIETPKVENVSTPLHFCVDEASQNRRALAAHLAAESGMEGKGGYDLTWCVAALEAANGDLSKAREWLKNWAPQRTEVSH
jgi:translation initiation factor IF-1